VPLETYRKLLPLGHDVICFGYPLTQKVPGEVAGVVVSINPMMFKGYIHCVWENVPVGQFRRVYTVNFPSLRGLSGAPLLCGHSSGRLLVAGIIHQSSEIGKILTGTLEYDDNGRKVVEKEYLGYQMGVASDFQPFVEIERLLIDISKKFKSVRSQQK